MSRPGKKRKMPAKPEKPRIDSSLQAFERAFQNRLGQRPIEWITAKLQNGSELSAIQSLFEIMSAEIELQYNCAMQPFSHYYEQCQIEKDVTPMRKKTMQQYNKLVRDRIPEIIEASGKTCTCETLSQERYLEMLDGKLNEELAEYQQSKSLEELADLLEVMGAVVKARGFTWEELTAIRKKKLEARGGFEKRILLKEVYEGTPCTTGEPRREPQKTLPKNAGKPWTELEDQKLTDEFDSKMPITTIAIEHGRTKGAIESRLARLGKISKPQTESSDK